MNTLAAKPAKLNDQHRAGNFLETLQCTPAVYRLSMADRLALYQRVRDYDHSADGLPYVAARDWGQIEYKGEYYFWKIDYYDLDLKSPSPDPSDPALTHRVLTLMAQSQIEDPNKEVPFPSL